jgi:hypothetical protein
MLATRLLPFPRHPVERFVQAVRRLGLDEVVFNELPVR